MFDRLLDRCFHQQIHGLVDEFIFTEASIESVLEWTDLLQDSIPQDQKPRVLRWLVDARNITNLPLNDTLVRFSPLLSVISNQNISLRVAYLVEDADTFTGLHSAITRLIAIPLHGKWFREGSDRQQAIDWLLMND